MSTSEQKEVNDLVMELVGDALNDTLDGLDPEHDEKIEMYKKFEVLETTHINVLISFEQMLDYIDKVRTSMKKGDIKDLLQIYITMSRSYYAQYERSLLEDIKGQNKTEKDAKRAIEKIKALQDSVLVTAIEPLEAVRSAATLEHQRLLEDFPSILQNAVDKLRDEWQRLGSIAIASQSLIEDQDLILWLGTVVNVAAHSIGINAERMVVAPGREFALYFFKYIDDIAVLTVPISSVQAPWEWSIFWHELAGYKVRGLENEATLTTLRNTLVENQAVLANITWDWGNKYSQKYLQVLFSSGEPDLIDLGHFEHEFEQMLASLPKKNRLQLYQQIKNQGWSVDWFEELFEDAWSVLAIGQEFLPFFEDVLRRHSVKDDRHPPMEVRMQVARELLRLMDQEPSEVQPKTPEAAAAEQILKFISLLIAATRKFQQDGDDLLKLQDLRDQLFVGMQEEIQDAIRHWEEKFVESGATPKPDGTFDLDIRAKNYAKNFINRFSSPDANDAITALRKAFANYSEKKKIKQDDNFFDTLKARDYKQLINLSFYDVDFGFPANSIKNIRFGNSIRNATKKAFTTIANTINIVLDGSSKVLGSGGDNDITYDGPDGTTYHAPIQNWNQIFASQPDYKLP